jgi:hypothetical protein
VRRDQLRDVVTLCHEFARNYTFHKVGRDIRYAHVFTPSYFWGAAKTNSLQLSILQFCTLFDREGEHHWSQVVRDPKRFELEILSHLRMSHPEWNTYIASVIRCRDMVPVPDVSTKLEQRRPDLEKAREAICFLHAYIVNQEAKPGDLRGLPIELEPCYRLYEDEATAVYESWALALKN